MNVGDLRVTCGLNEVKTRMDAVVDSFLTVDAVFLFKIGVKTSFNVVQNWFPASNKTVLIDIIIYRIIFFFYKNMPAVVVDKITETGGVYNSET